jgi:hypothetical protein
VTLADLFRSKNLVSISKRSDFTGITFGGPVLTGQQSLEQRRLEDAIQIATANLTGNNPVTTVIPYRLPGQLLVAETASAIYSRHRALRVLRKMRTERHRPAHDAGIDEGTLVLAASNGHQQFRSTA